MTKSTTRLISISTLQAPVGARIRRVGQAMGCCAVANVAGRRISGDVVGTGMDGAAVASLIRQIEREMPGATVREL
jgi:hypothetical protein